MKKIKTELEGVACLLRNIPAVVMVFFTLSVVFMNVFANKSIAFNSEWIALDCGFFLSWVAFLCMDMITKYFGPKASIQLTIGVALINVVMAGVLALIAFIPGYWGEFYTYENLIVNDALNATFAGTWYILLGSMIAFVVSGVVNALMNHAIGAQLKMDSFASYAIRSYTSTLVAQFVDNMCFALIVSRNFFGWTLKQCIICSLIGCVMELLCEVVFSPIGYAVCRRWTREKVGIEYINKYFSKKENQ